MVETKVRTEYPPVVLKMRPVVAMDDEQLLEFCAQNRELRIERTAEGDLEVTAPTGGETSNRNFTIAVQLGAWTEREGGIGVAFDSSGGFVLPNGAMRSPDAAWVRRERLAGLSAEQKRAFLPLCPDFVIELRSPSDPLSRIEAKMLEYLENEARLGWLLDPEPRRVYVYQPGSAVERVERATSISGEPELPGFVLDLRQIWEPGF